MLLSYMGSIILIREIYTCKIVQLKSSTINYFTTLTLKQLMLMEDTIKVLSPQLKISAILKREI